MSRCDATELERLRYWQGQMLRSRDFRDQLAIEAQLRAWHNRALHNTFGVSLGLAVSRVPVTTKNDPITAVRASCGLAYDCFGRELILQEAREIPVSPAPQGEQSLTLLIRYKETSRFPKRAEVEGGCLPGPCSPFGEEPDFIWKPSGRVEVADGVPLARVKYDDAKTPSLDEECPVPISRPLARPHVASGATIPGNTRWDLWSVMVPEQVINIGVQTTIDTLAAGFTETPCYFAWLQGPLWGRSADDFVAAPFAHIDLAAATGFTFRLWLPAVPILGPVITANQDVPAQFPAFAQKHQLFVCWLGIQPGSEGGDCNEVSHGNT